MERGGDHPHPARLFGGEVGGAHRADHLRASRAEAAETTGDLVACVDAAIPKKVRMQDNGHSARRTFQALRIAVNDELDPLKRRWRTWWSC